MAEINSVQKTGIVSINTFLGPSPLLYPIAHPSNLAGNHLRQGKPAGQRLKYDSYRIAGIRGLPKQQSLNKFLLWAVRCVRRQHPLHGQQNNLEIKSRLGTNTTWWRVNTG
ncbi:MAG TPA: hypothetical protein PKZ35_06010 [Gammaproteobacteria bacterium]|nr:hypothetical protein [Gammaproteobacteria bacterium]